MYQTGGSAGIGLATTKLLLSIGASVVNGDIQPPATGELDEKSSTLFVQTNVVNWTDLVVLFKKGKQHFGRIDSVFTNAGVRPRARYLEFEEDENGDLKEPNHEVFDINLRSVINTAYLGVHYMKEQPDGGSVVFMASSSAIQPFRRPDYSTNKLFPIDLYRNRLN
jgi:NAD(P)-dependent dehydrogenase (short-subunit alcohol dehydrogenase family)